MNAQKEYLVMKNFSNEERISYIKLYFSEISDPTLFLTEFATAIKVITTLEAEELAVKVNEQYKAFDEMRSNHRAKMRALENKRQRRSNVRNNEDSKEARIISLFPKEPKNK